MSKMAIDTRVHHGQPELGGSPPSLHYVDDYDHWMVDSYSNRSPIPEIKDSDSDSEYNNHQGFYTISKSNSTDSDMCPMMYPAETSVASQSGLYPSCRSGFPVSPAPERKSSLYSPTGPMNVVTSSVPSGLTSQRKPRYTPNALDSPNLYNSSPRASGLTIGNGPVFPSQIATKMSSDLNSLSENQPSSLPSSFIGASASTLAPPPMNRTHSGTILKASERRLFNGADSLPQISFHQNHPDAPPPGGLKAEYESSPSSIFSHHNGQYPKTEFESIPPLYSVTLPGMGSIHPTPYTNGSGHNTYFAAGHIEDVPTQGIHPQGLISDAFGEPSDHTFRKRDYHLMEYPHGSWSSPEGMQAQKPPKRRKSSANQPWRLSDDDKYLMKLKDDEQLPWKEIVNRFSLEGRGTYRVPALQMRLKRIKERIRQWTPEDEKYLEDAKKWLDKHYWEIVSGKIVEYGRKDKIPGTSCEKKWKELNARRESERDSKSGSGRLHHDDLQFPSQSQSGATTPATNYSGYEEEEECV